MTIDSITEMWSRRSGVRAATNGGKNSRLAFRAAYFITHSADATVPEILDAVPVQLYDQYSSQFAWADQIGDLEPLGPIASIVPVSYSGEATADNLGGPEAVPPVINWTNSATQEPVDTDAYGVPFTNTAGRRVDGFSKEVNDQTLTVVRNFSSFNSYLVNQYLDSVNSDVFADWPAGTAAMRQYTADFVSTDATAGLGYWTVTARIDFRVPYLVPAYRAWWYRYRNEGLEVVSGDYVDVTFSGGGASQQAQGHAVVTAGVITAVVVTDGGHGYTSTPTVTITGSVGSGATATANMTGSGFTRRVNDVTVSAGGTGYKSRLVRATDGNKEPVSTPVLLKRDGRQEFNARAAVFIERPMKQYALPYNQLGLL